MSEDKADDIPENASNDATPDQATTTEAKAFGDGPAASPDPQQDADKLSGLMAGGGAAAPKPKVDLEAEALRTVEKVLADGERALAEAREQLAHEQRAAAKRAPARGRELALRLLLAVNVLAMVVVALLPSPVQQQQPVAPAPTKEPVTETPIQPAPARMSEPWNRALRASERRDFAGAVAILEQHLADTPAMPPSERLSVLFTLANYAAKAGDTGSSERFRRQAQALEQSHSLPEDLVSMAEAALASGDQESLRRVWARFLLQQRQIPTWLYQHVAQAYLELGDSYRKDADVAAAAARERELAEAAARLRAEALERQESPK